MENLLIRMRSDLREYKGLPQHRANYRYKEALKKLKDWQTGRLLQTHASLLAKPAYRAATEFVLYDVYGCVGLYEVAIDVDRVLPVAAKLFSKEVMQTVAIALELNLLTARLDQDLMEAHFIELGYESVTEESYLKAFHHIQQFEARAKQIELAQSLSENIDRYIASRMIYMGFKMAKGPAQAAGLHSLYNFMKRGFDVLRPLGGAQNLLSCITQTERDVLAEMRVAVEGELAAV